MQEKRAHKRQTDVATWILCFFQHNIDYFWYLENMSDFPIDAIDIVVFVFAMIQAVEGHEVPILFIDDNSIEMVSLPQSTEKLIISDILFWNPLMF